MTALIILTVINLLNYIDRYIIAAVMPAMSAELGLNNTQAGMIMSAFMFGYFITSPLFGYLGDRYKRTHIISAGTAIWSLATAAAGLFKSFALIFVSRIVVGVGEASAASTSQSLLADSYPSQKRNQVMAVFSAAIPVGAALGFILGGLLAHHYGWRNAFFIVGVPGLLLALTVYFIKEPARGLHDDKQSFKISAGFKKDIFELIKNKSYRFTVLGYTAFSFTVGGLAAWVPQYLVQVRNIPLKEADTVFGAITVLTGTFGTLFGGYMAARALKKRPRGDMRFIFLLTLIAIPFTFGCFFIPDKNLFYICLALSEFFLFGTQPTVAVVIVECVSPQVRSLALAFCIFVIHLLGDLISTPAVGVIADASSLKLSILILPAALLFSAYFYKTAFKYLSKNAPITKPIG